jgi:hypothetical protein
MYAKGVGLEREYLHANNTEPAANSFD